MVIGQRMKRMNKEMGYKLKNKENEQKNRICRPKKKLNGERNRVTGQKKKWMNKQKGVTDQTVKKMKKVIGVTGQRIKRMSKEIGVTGQILYRQIDTIIVCIPEEKKWVWKGEKNRKQEIVKKVKENQLVNFQLNIQHMLWHPHLCTDITSKVDNVINKFACYIS